MGYLEVSVLWEGALENVVIIPDGANARVDTVYGSEVPASDLEELATYFEREVAGKSDTVEIFTLHHGHDNDGEECSCVQYATDHRPAFTFGGNN